MITQAEYARHSGLTKGRVSQLVKAGMPLDSVEAADRWRGPAGKGLRTTPPLEPTIVPDPPIPANPPPAAEAPPPDRARVADDSPEGAFERQKQIERAAFGLAVKALKERQPDAARLVQIHAAAASNLIHARDAVVNQRLRDGTLLTADWVKRIILEHDGAVATLVKAMPRALAGRIAPHDPEHAQRELDRWVQEDFLRLLHQTNPWTKTTT